MKWVLTFSGKTGKVWSLRNQERRLNDDKNMHGSIAGIRKFVQIPILALLVVCTFFLQADQLDPENTEPRSAHSAKFTGSANLLDIATVEISAPASAAPASAAPESAVPESPAPEIAAPEIAVPESVVPEIAVPEIAVPEKVADDFLDNQPWIEAKIRKGDTLSHLFRRHGLASKEAYLIVQLEEAKRLEKIMPGETIRLKKNREGKLGLLQYSISLFNLLHVQADQGSYQAHVEIRVPEIRINNAKAIIYDSLLGAASDINLSYDIIFKVIHLFGWQIDFTQDLRVGDQFLVIYEELYLDGEKIGEGEIVAAELIVSGKSFQAIRFSDEKGFSRYFTPDGSNVSGTFLRSPLKFGHITSSFSHNRLHPIKKVWRAHKGVDYGAPAGTPVMATGDGMIAIARRNSGYGKTVIIRHGGVYDTLYAHLSGYGKNISPGKRVNQGDIIGYVGSTGLATGSHLHYEFRINGVHHNPATVEIPKSTSIEEKYRDGFLRLAKYWVAELEYLNRLPLARSEPNQ